ncbi:MAG TPA: hypothetical protein VLL51_10635 [Gemmatimonadales bacterium]|nr:hypothetical protein [Gemmatimonadales bacterium]
MDLEARAATAFASAQAALRTLSRSMYDNPGVGRREHQMSARFSKE